MILTPRPHSRTRPGRNTTPACRCSTASTWRAGSFETDRQAPWARAVRGIDEAWISTSRGRVPSWVTRDAGAGNLLVLGGKIAEVAACRPGPSAGKDTQLIHRAKAVLEGSHQAEGGVGIALEVKHCVDRCLSTLGPASEPSCDMADHDREVTLACFACRVSSWRRIRAPVRPSRVRTARFQVNGLDQSITATLGFDCVSTARIRSRPISGRICKSPG